MPIPQAEGLPHRVTIRGRWTANRRMASGDRILPFLQPPSSDKLDARSWETTRDIPHPGEMRQPGCTITGWLFQSAGALGVSVIAGVGPTAQFQLSLGQSEAAAQVYGRQRRRRLKACFTI